MPSSELGFEFEAQDVSREDFFDIFVRTFAIPSYQLLSFSAVADIL